MRDLVSRVRAATFVAVLAGVQLAMAVALYVNWESDNNIIRQQALTIAEMLPNAAERIIAINNWTYDNKGFEKNREYFLLPQLGPTPLQILESGGDCSDKSRLVAAMLNQLGIHSGLLMISPCAGCAPIHTVVEAVYEHGRMIVDPIWNIYYPEGESDRFLGAAELAGTERGYQHLLHLQQLRGPSDKISLMPTAEATFDFTKSVNWEANWGTRAASKMLKAAGYSPETILRPRMLEDPKLAMSMFAFVGGVGCVVPAIFAFCFRWIRQSLVWQSPASGRRKRPHRNTGRYRADNPNSDRPISLNDVRSKRMPKADRRFRPSSASYPSRAA